MKHIVTDEWCYGSTDEYFTEEFPTKEEGAICNRVFSCIKW